MEASSVRGGFCRRAALPEVVSLEARTDGDHPVQVAPLEGGSTEEGCSTGEHPQSESGPAGNQSYRRPALQKDAWAEAMLHSWKVTFLIDGSFRRQPCRLAIFPKATLAAGLLKALRQGRQPAGPSTEGLSSAEPLFRKCSLRQGRPQDRQPTVRSALQLGHPPDGQPFGRAASSITILSQCRLAPEIFSIMLFLLQGGLLQGVLRKTASGRTTSVRAASG